MNDVFPDATDDEVTLDPDTLHDPEVTTAADATWLAELRGKARATDRTMSDVLAQEADVGSADARDDEITIAPSDDTMDAVRAAVVAARSESPSAPVTDRREHSVDPAADRRPEPTADSRPGSQGRALETSRASATQQPTPAQRWEPPQRLAPAVELNAPMLRDAVAHDPLIRRLLIGILLVGIAALALVAFVVFGGSDDAPPQVPDDSLVDSIVVEDES